MNLEVDVAFGWCAALTAIANLIAVYEHRRLRSHLDAGAPWAWETVRDAHRDAPRWILRLSAWEARHPNLFAASSALASLWVIFDPALLPLLVLLAATLVMSHRWAGAAGGGSDSMMLQLLGALCLGAAWGTPSALGVALYFIAVQCLLSYTLAGVAKLRCSAWRDGTAIAAFCASHGIRSLPWKHPTLHRAACVGVLAFECTAAVAVIDPRISVGWIALALAFHGANTIVFGLHRFTWTWLATYPALIFTASVVGRP